MSGFFFVKYVFFYYLLERKQKKINFFFFFGKNTKEYSVYSFFTKKNMYKTKKRLHGMRGEGLYFIRCYNLVLEI